MIMRIDLRARDEPFDLDGPIILDAHGAGAAGLLEAPFRASALHGSAARAAFWPRVIVIFCDLALLTGATLLACAALWPRPRLPLCCFEFLLLDKEELVLADLKPRPLSWDCTGSP